MGTIVSREKLPVQKNATLIIYCNNGDVFSNESKDISLEIARKLIEIPEKARTLKITNTISDIVKKYPDETIFKGFDVLFNPSYQIDIIKVLTNIRKQHIFKIIWPGTFADSQLIYSEEGFKDYAKFNIDNYDITCVI